jgi:hypothetical protein
MAPQEFKKKNTGGVDQVVEHLPNKCQTLSSSPPKKDPSPTKKAEKIQEKEGKEVIKSIEVNQENI